MNPVLVKPEGRRRKPGRGARSADPELSRLPWRERAARLAPAGARARCDSLADEHELLVIEGAGSPAEINLADCDLANLAVARHAEARVLLVADIDRGGAFAHLYGTWQLLAAPDRARIAGLILNRFRGDRGAARPGAGAPARADRRADARRRAADQPRPARRGRRRARAASGRAAAARVAVVRYPTASNLDEFRLLEQVATLEWAAARGIESPTWSSCPGPSTSAPTCEWLRERGLADALARRVAAGGRVLGICGGMQMPATPARRRRRRARRDGLGPAAAARRCSRATKRVGSRRRALRRAARAVGARSRVCRRAATRSATGRQPSHVGERVPWRRCRTGSASSSGPVLGVYPHGLFEDAAIVRALLGATPRAALEQAFDELADAVAAHLDLDAIDALGGRRMSCRSARPGPSHPREPPARRTRRARSCSSTPATARASRRPRSAS